MNMAAMLSLSQAAGSKLGFYGNIMRRPVSCDGHDNWIGSDHHGTYDIIICRQALEMFLCIYYNSFRVQNIAPSTQLWCHLSI
jgi:hypothetical protein